MGGGGKKVFNDVVNVVHDWENMGIKGATLGLYDRDQGQKVLDDAGLNPSAKKTAIENEGKKAEAEQAAREADMAENKTQAETAKRNATKRNRQRSMMGANSGRSSTILTGLGDVGGTGSGSGKTLLGS